MLHHREALLRRGLALAVAVAVAVAVVTTASAWGGRPAPDAAATARALDGRGPLVTPEGRTGVAAVIVSPPGDRPVELGRRLAAAGVRAVYVVPRRDALKDPRRWRVIGEQGHLLAIPAPGRNILDVLRARITRSVLSTAAGREVVLEWSEQASSAAALRARSGRPVVTGPPGPETGVTVISGESPALPRSSPTTDLGVAEPDLHRTPLRSTRITAAVVRGMDAAGGVLGRVALVGFAAAVALTVLRVVLLVPLALLHARRRRVEPAPHLSATVLVPAFDEERVIAATLDSIFRSDHERLGVIVIDDGSNDDTSGAALRWAEENGVPTSIDGAIGTLTVHRVPNGGKASALNAGLALAESDVVVVVDGDTQLSTSAISKLTAHFRDPAVVAVAGNVKVGNPRGFVALLQAIEYVVGQNLVRRASEVLNAITVVPGALGAFRPSAVRAAGGYASDTLAEDTDLTVALAGPRRAIRYESQALAFTEAPRSWRTLARQRFRWSFGSMQVLWKHRRDLFRRRKGAVGVLGLPALLLFEVMLPVVAPLVDVAAVVALATGSARTLLPGYVLVNLVDIALAALSVRLDRERARLVWFAPFQRVVFRQFIYVVVARALWCAVQGRPVGWNKLDRTGDVAVDSGLGRRRPAALP